MSKPKPTPRPAAIDLAAAIARAHAGSNHHVARFTAQIEFARGLAKALPKESAGWPALIERAEQTVAEGIASGEASRIEAAVAKAEAQLAPIGTVAKTFTIHCAGHAHIDMNWLWGWQETVACTVDTFETVLKLMDEFPDFCFTQSQASVYQIAKDYNPELFARIKAKVKQGRWEVVASNWVEGDKNLASGESLCRHLLYTRRFMKEELGLEPEDVTVDWSPDTFGHAHTIPSIDARGGVKHYYMCRSGANDRPAAFWWKGPDGSKVLVNREIQWYNSELRPHVSSKLLEFHGMTGLRDWMQVYGVGDHGGGPTRRDLKVMQDMDGWPIFPNWKFATSRSFFKILEKAPNLPTLDQELNYEFTGCYTTQTSIKRNNRYGENLMSEADAAAAIAHASLGREYPCEQLAKSWRDVLFSHFHDILPGSGIRQTREYNAGMFQRIQASAGQIRTQSLRALAQAIDTTAGGRFDPTAPAQLPEHESMAMGAGSGRAANDISNAGFVPDGGRAFVFFNPTAWVRSEIVTATVWDMDNGPNAKPMKDRSYVVTSADGTVVAAQRVGEGHYWGHNFVELAFPVAVGALGWSTCIVTEGAHPQGVKPGCWLHANDGYAPMSPSPRVLENDLVRVAFDRRTGGITSLILKSTGEDLVDREQPAGVLEYALERAVGMSAWVLGDVQQRATLDVEALDVTASGPYVATMRAKAKVNGSRFTVDYTVRAGSPVIEVKVTGTWTEIGRADLGIPRLSMRFPLALAGAKARYEIPYGSIERSEPAGQEVPSLRWADLVGTARPAVKEGAKAPKAGKTAGVTLLNDSKYGHSLDGSTLRLTLIRSSYDPDPIPEVAQHAIRMAVVPHAGVAPVADLVRLGASFNHPLQVIGTNIHQGRLPHTIGAGVACEQSGVLVTQIKRAEDSDALIVRLQETTGTATKVTIPVSAEIFGRLKSAVEADLLERDSRSSTAKVRGSAIEVTVPGFGIATVKAVFVR
jgi:alpha-mannosidase